MDAQGTDLSQGLVALDKGGNGLLACGFCNTMQGIHHYLLNRVIFQMIHHPSVQFDDIHRQVGGQTVAFHRGASALQRHSATDSMQGIAEHGHFVRILGGMGFPDLQAEALRPER